MIFLVVVIVLTISAVLVIKTRLCSRSKCFPKTSLLKTQWEPPATTASVIKQSGPVVYFWESFTFQYFLQWTRVFLFYSSDRDRYQSIPVTYHWWAGMVCSLRAKGQDWESLAVNYCSHLPGVSSEKKSLKWLLLLSVGQCLPFHILTTFLSRFISPSKMSLY